MTNQLQSLLRSIIALEAENKRLREAIAEAEAHLSIHVCKNGDNQEIVAVHLLSCAMNHSTQTTGLLELARVAFEFDQHINIPGTRLRFEKAVQALSPEVRKLLEDMA